MILEAESSDQFRKYCWFPWGAYKDQIHVFMQELFEVLEATVKASGMSGGLNGSLWEMLNINFIKLYD